MFNCVVRSNVCGDGGHIIRLPEYRPGSLCMHNAENLKIWHAPSRLTLMTSVLRYFLHSLSSIPIPCFITVNVPQRDTLLYPCVYDLQ